MLENLDNMSPRERGDYHAREAIAEGRRVYEEDSRQRVLSLDRTAVTASGEYIETHIDDWAARLRDAQDGLGPWPLPVGHIVFGDGC